MNETVMIIDLGTTNIKAVVFNNTGRVLFECSRPTPFRYEHESMEIDPQALRETVRAVCGEAICAVGGDFAAVSITSMAASFIPLDRDNQPLHHGVGWADGRSIAAMQEHMHAFIEGARIPGCGQYPLQMYLPYKLQWFATYRPDVLEKAAHWVNVSEYMYALLTGDTTYHTDFSIASRTMLFDTEKRCWNRNALDRFAIDEKSLSIPVAAGTVIGTVGKAMQEIGFNPRTPVVMGGHDHMCSLPGAGIIADDRTLNTTGTSEAMVAVLPPNGHTPESIAGNWLNTEAGVLPGTVALVGYVGASGRVFQSLDESVGAHASENETPLSTMPIFLPPQRSQLTSVQGELRGLQPSFSSAILYRAICDGLYMECRRVLERVDRVRRRPIASLTVVGGHAKNIPEMERKSAALGLPLDLVRQTNIASKGAAVVAGVGCGLFSTPHEAIASMCKGDIMHIEPDQQMAMQFDTLYRTRYLPCFAHGIDSL